MPTANHPLITSQEERERESERVIKSDSGFPAACAVLAFVVACVVLAIILM